MVKPVIPENEIERLNNLLSYNILDSPSERDYDEIVQLASQICEAPISLVSLIDKDRQWFKAKIGIQVQETHRDISFCAHAILQDDIFEVEDASKDYRFFDNPAVTGELNVRFYAGMPLKTPEGYNIGTLCVVGSQPKTLTPFQKHALKVLARQVIIQLELRKHLQELNTAYQLLQEKEKTLLKQHQTILESIRYAENIQKSILISPKEIQKKFPDSFILWLPRDIVSGDFYFFLENNSKIFFACVDCTGHGVPGAFMTMLAYNTLRTIIEHEKIHSPECILLALENKVIQYLNQRQTGYADGMDMTLCVIDIKKQMMEVAGARNSLFIFEKGVCTTIPADKISIGGEKKQDVQFTKHQITIQPHQCFYMFSDGYAHQFDEQDKNRFLQKRLLELLYEIHEQDFDQQKQILMQKLNTWKGKNKQTDDILVIGFKVPEAIV